ncbi:MAG: symmetrical bis(5'-nucleosyl)-tetraphosphatase [Betaproteobacteria bacterium]
MALYLIGDVQGCDAALARLLNEISFSPSRDTLYLLGDLVNRGPDSLGVLRRLMALKGAAHCLLGNHDLHLLAIAHGVRPPGRGDTLGAVLDAPDRRIVLGWLRQQSMALQLQVAGHNLLLVHAGVLPQWTCAQTLARAAEVEDVLRAPTYGSFLTAMYGNTPAQWSDGLRGAERLRVVVNALTRLRFCDAQGQMEFESKEGPGQAPAGFMPWFDVPGRRTAHDTVVFGHWSTLGPLNRHDVVAMDTGCVWGGCLSALRLEPQQAPGPLAWSVAKVRCEAAQRPGGGDS